jgi:ABC-type lipoprotein export system ATPase subunit
MAEEERRERATSLLRQMQMDHRLNQLPGTLSGGEKQRVAIARALINHPQIIFADEPTGNLDTHTGHAIMEILTTLHREQGLSILMVTHDLELSKSADRLLCMQDGALIP